MSGDIAKGVRRFAKGLRVTAYNGQAGMLLNESARHLGDAADALDAKDKRIAELEAHKRAQTEDIMRLGGMVGRMLRIADDNGFGDAVRNVIAPPSSPAGDANG